MFKNIESSLKKAEIPKNNIVNCHVFLTDMKNYQQFNDLYENFFGEHKPTRSCVAVKELPKGGLVEMDFIAYN